MKKLPPSDILKFTMFHSLESVQFYQELIDEWNDPENIVQRAAVLLRDTNKMYGQMSYMVFKLIKKPNCKHPKKMQDTCAGQLYCMNCNEDLETT